MIRIENLSKNYSHHQILKDINLTIHPQEFICLVGESGSGKTTLLKLIAGLIRPDRGGILIEGKPVYGINKDVSLVFQNGALFPWLNAYENIIFPFRVQKKLFDQKKINSIIGEVGLKNLEQKYPRDLSGGQRQRVGIARALAVERKIMLLDEPFSALDIKTASELRTDLLDLWKSKELTVIMVSHLVEEAVELADRIIVLKGGQLHSKLSIDLKRPRETESENFIRLADHLKEIIEE